MEDKRLKRVFDRVQLPPEREEAMLAELLSGQKEVAGMKQMNNRRRIPAALAAAALVAVLAGTALAAGYFGRIAVTPIAGHYENGYMAQGEMRNITLEELSEEFLGHAREAAAAGEEWEAIPFDSWPEAEAFFGVQTAKNSVLEKLEPGEVGTQRDGEPMMIANCIAYVDYFHDGLPGNIALRTGYRGDGYGVGTTVTMQVKASAADEDTPYQQYDVSGVSTGAEQYTTPKGLETAIVTNDVRGGGEEHPFHYTTYTAHFVLNKASYEVRATADSDRDDVDALYALKEILDAYE